MAFIFSLVPEYKRLIRFRFGHFDGARGPGWVWVIPFLHSAQDVDLREEVLDVDLQTTITRDNAPVSVDMLIYLRVVDAEAAVLRVQSYRGASRGMAITTLRAVLGDMTLDDVLSKREHINEVMQVRLDEVTGRWGVKVNAVEIREILPPHDIQQAMSRQMSAERTRRAVVTEAEGTRAAAILTAEGDRQAAILSAEGAKQAAILAAEANREAAILNAEGFSLALERVFAVARGVDQNTMNLQYLDMLRTLGGGQSTKWIIPMEFTQLLQGLGRTVAAGAQPPLQDADGPG